MATETPSLHSIECEEIKNTCFGCVVSNFCPCSLRVMPHDEDYGVRFLENAHMLRWNGDCECILLCFVVFVCVCVRRGGRGERIPARQLMNVLTDE